MKKRFWLFCLVLMLFLTGSAPAEVDAGINLFMITDYSAVDGARAQSAAAAGDTLYLLTVPNMAQRGEAALEKWQSGMAASETVLEGLYVYQQGEGENKNVVSRLFGDGKCIYGYDSGTDQVLRLVDENGNAAVEPLFALQKPEKEKNEGEMYGQEVLAMFVQDQVLYVHRIIYGEMDSQTTIACYDMRDGKLLSEKESKELSGLSPYRDGKLLALFYPNGVRYDESKGEQMKAVLGTYDPATGALEKLAETPWTDAAGLMYNAKTDTAYVCNGSKLYELPDVIGTPQVAAYMPSAIWQGGGSFAVLENGLYVAATYEGVYVRRPNAEAVKNGALVVSGDYGSEKHRKVVAAYPDMSITADDAYLNGMEELSKAMVSGENSVDVLMLDSSYRPVEKLIEKGYAADLSANEEIRALTDEMDTRFTDFLRRDGKLYGVPVGVDGQMMVAYKETMEKLGLTPEDLPKTMVEFYDFCANFYYDYGEEHADVKLMEYPQVEETLFRDMMQLYMAYQMATEEVARFDTPLFRKLLTGLSAIDYTEIDPYAVLGDDAWNDESMNEFWNKKALFGTYSANIGTLSEESRVVPMVLPLDEGVEPLLPVSARVLLVNPRTTRMDQALAYVSEYAKQYDPETEGVILFPDHNEPVPNRWYEMNMIGIQNAIAETQGRLEAAEEENKAAIREQLVNMQENLAELEKQRMSVTKEMLTQYRAQVTPAFYVMQQSPLSDFSSEAGQSLDTLMQQYLDGAVDMEKFIREMDNRVRMMMLEDQ